MSSVGLERGSEGSDEWCAAWQLSEGWMPPAQCRVTWTLSSSQEGRVVPPPLANLKSFMPSPGRPQFIAQQYSWFFFFFLVGMGLEGDEKRLFLETFKPRSSHQRALCDCEQSVHDLENEKWIQIIPLSFLPVSASSHLQNWQFSLFVNSAELKGLSEMSYGPAK